MNKILQYIKTHPIVAILIGSLLITIIYIGKQRFEIKELKNEVNNLEVSNNRLQNEIDDLEIPNINQQNEINDLEEKVNNLEEKISNLESELDDCERKLRYSNY